MDQDTLFLAIDEMRLELGNVVCDIVNDRQVHSLTEYTLECSAHGMTDQLAVGPGKVRRTGHCMQIALSLRRLDGRTCELTVGHMKAVSPHRLVQLTNIVRANLMT